MMTDIEIAQKAEMKHIREVAAKLGISEDDLDLYGKYKAKLSDELIKKVEGNENGKLILVTAINPTPAGEGKTTITVGLGEAMGQLGKKAVIALREPSLGPCFGIKGGAAGGGYAQVVPMEDLNLHFTGDFHAITSANNLLAAMMDNHIQQGNALRIDVNRIVFKRCMDMNDRVLRHTVVGLGKRVDGVPREDGFVITVASEIMAILCLASDMKDLQERLGRIIVAYNMDNEPVTAADLKAVGAMAALLKDAIKPNLIQTLEHTPAIVHGGPFANIAHGCNSVMATKTALKLADYVITEAGFGADLGAEKFFDIKCRMNNLKPDAVVLVATVRALKYNGGVAKADLGEENLDALKAGIVNLEKHIENLQKFVIDNDLDIGFAYDGEGYYLLSTETDDEYNIISQRIIRYDDKLNLSEDDILRNITCDGRVDYMLASDGYLYYTESFQNGGTYTDNVCRIRLSDYYKETVLAAPDAQRLSRYLDLLTIWSGDSDDYSYSGMCKYRNNLYLQTDNYKVFVLDLNTGTRRLLFSENYINGDISVIDGKVFYLNSDGNPVCFDNEKKIISERMFYAIASDREYIYCSNNSVTYRYKVSDLSEEKFADKGEAYMADRSCVYFGDGTYMDAYGKQVEIPQAEDGSIFLANGRVIVKNSDGTLEFSDK